MPTTNADQAREILRLISRTTNVGWLRVQIAAWAVHESDEEVIERVLRWAERTVKNELGE